MLITSHQKLILFLCLALYSCGGKEGGGNSSNSTSGVDEAKLAVEVFNKINETRAQNGLSTLTWNDAAATNAKACAKANLDPYLQDTSAQDIGKISTVHYRNGVAEDQIIQFSKVKENLYTTTITTADVPADAIARWLASAAHKENLLWEFHFALGIGIATAKDARGRTAIVISAGFVCQRC